MRQGWIVGLLFLWLIGALLGGVAEGTFLGEGERTVVDRLLSPTLGEISNPWEATTAFFTMGGDWLDALWSVLILDYSFFEGETRYVRYLFLSVAIGIVMALALAWFRGTPST